MYNFEKGIKPVKAKKYYYFTHQKMYKELEENKLDHNHFDAGTRGEWRKYNPYNPYVPETDKKAAENLKVESLDDLFEDNDEKEKNIPKDIPNTEKSVKEEKSDILNNIEIDETPAKQQNIEIEEKPKKQETLSDLFDFEDFDSPTLPQGDEEKEEKKPQLFTEDIQKELEAKFDELFGPMEE